MNSLKSNVICECKVFGGKIDDETHLIFKHVEAGKQLRYLASIAHDLGYKLDPDRCIALSNAIVGMQFALWLKVIDDVADGEQKLGYCRPGIVFHKDPDLILNISVEWEQKHQRWVEIWKVRGKCSPDSKSCKSKPGPLPPGVKQYRPNSFERQMRIGKSYGQVRYRRPWGM